MQTIALLAVIIALSVVAYTAFKSSSELMGE